MTGENVERVLPTADTLARLLLGKARENMALGDGRFMFTHAEHEVSAEIAAALQAAVAGERQLREAVAFYADPASWTRKVIETSTGEHALPWSAPVEQDNGDRARAALRALDAAGGEQ